jgi:hypothetical protein
MDRTYFFAGFASEVLRFLMLHESLFIIEAAIAIVTEGRGKHGGE